MFTEAQFAGIPIPVVGAFVAATAAITAAAVSGAVSIWTTRAKRSYDSEDALSKFRKPLMRAAYDLQSRIFNIADKDFLSFVNSTEADEQNYAVQNTLFVIAQFFAWNEILRREIQFADAARDRTGSLSVALDSLTSIWSSDNDDPTFRVFSGEQRAIGERMIEDRNGRPDCIGYAEFCDRLETTRIPYMARLEEGIRKSATATEGTNARLLKVQQSLIDLLKMLDPKGSRLPRTRLTKVHSDSAT